MSLYILWDKEDLYAIRNGKIIYERLSSVNGGTFDLAVFVKITKGPWRDSFYSLRCRNEPLPSQVLSLQGMNSWLSTDWIGPTSHYLRASAFSEPDSGNWHSWREAAHRRLHFEPSSMAVGALNVVNGVNRKQLSAKQSSLSWSRGVLVRLQINKQENQFVTDHEAGSLINDSFPSIRVPVGLLFHLSCIIIHSNIIIWIDSMEPGDRQIKRRIRWFMITPRLPSRTEL